MAGRDQVLTASSAAASIITRIARTRTGARRGVLLAPHQLGMALKPGFQPRQPVMMSLFLEARSCQPALPQH
jgi:hypothetical protein